MGLCGRKKSRRCTNWPEAKSVKVKSKRRQLAKGTSQEVFGAEYTSTQPAYASNQQDVKKMTRRKGEVIYRVCKGKRSVKLECLRWSVFAYVQHDASTMRFNRGYAAKHLPPGVTAQVRLVQTRIPYSPEHPRPLPAMGGCILLGHGRCCVLCTYLIWMCSIQGGGCSQGLYCCFTRLHDHSSMLSKQLHRSTAAEPWGVWLAVGRANCVK